MLDEEGIAGGLRARLEKRAPGEVTLEEVWEAALGVARAPLDGVDAELDEDLLLFETFQAGAPYPRDGVDHVVAFTRQFSRGGGDLRHISIVLRWSPPPAHAPRASQVLGVADDIDEWARAVAEADTFAQVADQWPPAEIEVEAGLI